MRRRISYLAVLTITALFAAACGSDGGTTNAGGGDAAAGGGGGSALSITSPADGATVSQPFMLKFQTTAQLGEPDTGRDHIHVFADGKEDKYTVVPGDSFEMKDLSSGKHTIGVTLQRADHSPAGASAQITVNVSGGGAPAENAPSSAPTTDGDDGY